MAAQPQPLTTYPLATPASSAQDTKETSRRGPMATPATTPPASTASSASVSVHQHQQQQTSQLQRGPAATPSSQARLASPPTPPPLVSSPKPAESPIGEPLARHPDSHRHRQPHQETSPVSHSGIMSHQPDSHPGTSSISFAEASYALPPEVLAATALQEEQKKHEFYNQHQSLPPPHSASAHASQFIGSEENTHVGPSASSGLPGHHQHDGMKMSRNPTTSSNEASQSQPAAMLPRIETRRTTLSDHHADTNPHAHSPTHDGSTQDGMEANDPQLKDESTSLARFIKSTSMRSTVGPYSPSGMDRSPRGVGGMSGGGSAASLGLRQASHGVAADRVAFADTFPRAMSHANSQATSGQLSGGHGGTSPTVLSYEDVRNHPTQQGVQVSPFVDPERRDLVISRENRFKSLSSASHRGASRVGFLGSIFSRPQANGAANNGNSHAHGHGNGSAVPGAGHAAHVGARPQPQHEAFSGQQLAERAGHDHSLIVIPTCYVFIFVNSRSGNRQGRYLIDINIQNFRLKNNPFVQVQIYNFLDEVDRNAGIRYLRTLQLASAGPNNYLKIDQLHVWSAGGDGTFMGVISGLIRNEIDITDERLLFCVIPFGTGNDLSQVMGWGRSVPDNDPAGKHLDTLNDLVERRLKGLKARLDIWEVEIQAAPGGYIQKAIKLDSEYSKVWGEPRQKLVRIMSNYASLGVQGYVGVGFERNRRNSRFMNIIEYTKQSVMWTLIKTIPSISQYLTTIENGDVTIPAEDIAPSRAELKKLKKSGGISRKRARTMRHKPVELIIENIPAIWGRHVDLWAGAKMEDGYVTKPDGPTAMKNWAPQKASDGMLEVFSISNLWSYFKKQLPWARDHLRRIGQFTGPLRFNFTDTAKTRAMIDGEFYELIKPKFIEWRRLCQITIVGPSIEGSRLVRDEVMLPPTGHYTDLEWEDAINLFGPHGEEASAAMRGQAPAHPSADVPHEAGHAHSHPHLHVRHPSHHRTSSAASAAAAAVRAGHPPLVPPEPAMAPDTAAGAAVQASTTTPFESTRAAAAVGALRAAAIPMDPGVGATSYESRGGTPVAGKGLTNSSPTTHAHSNQFMPAPPMRADTRNTLVAAEARFKAQQSRAVGPSPITARGLGPSTKDELMPSATLHSTPLHTAERAPGFPGSSLSLPEEDGRVSPTLGSKAITSKVR